MNKNEIIEALACSVVLPGDQLVEKIGSIETTHDTIEAQLSRRDVGGLRVGFARDFVEILKIDSQGIDGVSPELFRSLHESTLKLFLLLLNGQRFELFAHMTREGYAKIIGRLHEFAVELNITYDLPDDSLLKK